MFKRQTLWMGAVLLAIVWFAVSNPFGRKAIEVQAAQVERGDLASDFVAEGYVKARSVKLAPRVSGRVVAIYVKEGDRVKKDGLIAKLYDDDLALQSRIAAQDLLIASEAWEQAKDALASANRAWEAERRTAVAVRQGASARLERLLVGARPEELAIAEQRASLASAQLETARSGHDRAQRLHQEGAISDAEFERARLALNTAELDLQSAREAVALLKKGATSEEIEVGRAEIRAAEAAIESVDAKKYELLAQRHALEASLKRVGQARQRLRESELAQSDNIIKAPFDGRLANLLVEVGDIVSPLSAVATFVDDTLLEIEAEIGDQDLALVVPALPVTVTTASLPGKEFTGLVVRTAAEAEQKPNTLIRTRIVRATIVLDRAEREMIPGTEVTVEGTGTLVKDCVLIVSDALMTDSVGQYVWVLQDGQVQRRNVKTGAVTYDKTQVLAGLEVGETVVTAQKEALSSGARVIVKQK